MVLMIIPIDRAELLSRTRRACADGTLRRLRIGAGLSIRDASDACDANPATFYRWERGFCVPTKRTHIASLEIFIGRLTELVDGPGG
jgi:hypothetical protein